MAQWNLRQQLEDAEAQRRLAAGLAVTPTGPDATSGPRAAAMTLPLWQGPAGTPLGPPEAAAGEVPPSVATRRPIKDRCPHCGGGVRLDRFDLVDAVAHMSCTGCGFAYQARSPKT